jgi:2-amino-4-hydroxy-6-hydroxymethyldihydropteridine diphosphokinase
MKAIERAVSAQHQTRGLLKQHRCDRRSAQLLARGNILIALGANCPGPWGTAAETIVHALGEIERANVEVSAVSQFYETEAVGRARQPAYVNAVASIDTSLPAEALLRVLKAIESKAGRRGAGRPWGPRTLDIDIIDYRGLIRHWRGLQPEFIAAGRRPLVLPHPLAHERPFVLRPLLDVAPDWRHPALKEGARKLWREAQGRGEGRVIRRL